MRFPLLSARVRLILLVVVSEAIFIGGLYYVDTLRAARISTVFRQTNDSFNMSLDRTFRLRGEVLDREIEALSAAAARPSWRSASELAPFARSFDFYAFLDDAFNTFPGSVWEARSRLPAQLLEGREFARGLGAGGSHYFIRDGQNLLEVRARQVSGVHARYVVTGKYLDKADLEMLANVRGGFRVELLPPSAEIPKPDPVKMLFRAAMPLPGLNGEPVGYLFSERQAANLIELDRDQNMDFAALIAFSLILITASGFLIRKWVTRPLLALQRCLERRLPQELAAVRRGSPEFVSIADSLEDYFRQREALELEHRAHMELAASLKKSEDKFNVLVSVLEDSVFTVDKAGVCTSFFGAPLPGDIKQGTAVGMTTAALFGSAYSAQVGVVESALAGNPAETRWTASGYGEGSRVFRLKALPLRGPGGEVSGAVCVSQDVSDIARAERKMRDAELDAKDFSVKLIAVREEEKKKLSYVMHDEVGSYEVAMSAALSMADTELRNGDAALAADALTRAKTYLKELISLTKNVSADLRPHGIEIAGLCGTLKELARKTQEKWRMEVRMNCDFQGEDVLSESAKLMFFRVTQEALTNAVKHASAKNVTIKFDLEDDYVVLSVEDDGRGFSISPEDTGRGTPHLGLRSMREYALSVGAKLEIETGTGMGTIIKVRLPLPPAVEEEEQA